MRRRAAFACGLALAVAWFVWLRPASLGGDVSYVVVQGSSMAPTYEDGDLVVVREDRAYEPGDVVAYRAGGTLDDPTRVIHRIVSTRPDGAFVTQGDNRDRVDPWAPTPDQVIGRAVLHVPVAGGLAETATRPAVLAGLGAAAVLVGRRTRRRRRMSVPSTPTPAPTPAPVPRPERVKAAPPARWARFTHPRWAFAGLLVTTLLAVPVLAVTWSALRAADTVTRTEGAGQVDFGVQSHYRFVGEPSRVYPGGVVTSSANPVGQLVPSAPLYSQLLHRLEVSLGFQASEEGADRLRSWYSVEVVVAVPTGWSDRVTAVGPKRFNGTLQTMVPVDLKAVAAQIREVSALTGVGGDTYTVRVTPTLRVKGQAGGRVVEEDLATPLEFAFDGNVVTAKATAAETGSQPLARTVTEDRRFSFGVADLDVQTARGLLSGLALVLVAGAVWFASVVFGGVGLGESERIAVRYRSKVVDVTSATHPPGPVVMVGAIHELAHIAKMEQTVMLHEELRDGAHRYRVFLGNVTYEYMTVPEHAGGVVVRS